MTRCLNIRHNYPANYVEAIGETRFLDDDVCTQSIVEQGAPFLWSSAPKDLPPEMARRIEIDEAHGISVGVSFALPFDGGRGAAGMGLCSRSMSEGEFARFWECEKEGLTLFVTAFDAVMRDRMVARLYQLTPREREVLAHAAGGMGAKEIAHQLDIAPKTVFNTLERARRSLQASNTIEAVAKAYVYRLI